MLAPHGRLLAEDEGVLDEGGREAAGVDAHLLVARPPPSSTSPAGATLARKASAPAWSSTPTTKAGSELAPGPGSRVSARSRSAHGSTSWEMSTGVPEGVGSAPGSSAVRIVRRSESCSKASPLRSNWSEPSSIVRWA